MATSGHYSEDFPNELTLFYKIRNDWPFLILHVHELATCKWIEKRRKNSGKQIERKSK